MREMVFRERHEKVAHLKALTRIAAQLFNLDGDKVFGPIVNSYASEVFQETYDAELLKQKMAAITAAQKRIQAVQKTRARQLTRLDRLGEFYDLKLGPEIAALKRPAKSATIKPIDTARPRKPPG